MSKIQRNMKSACNLILNVILTKTFPTSDMNVTTKYAIPLNTVERQTHALRTTSQNITHGKRSSMIVHINTRSILKHMDELRLIFGDVYPSMIAITETWLDDSVADSEISILKYSLERLDRNTNRRGGGEAFYLMDGLK